MKVVDLKIKIDPNAFQHANAHLKQIIHYELPFFKKYLYISLIFFVYIYNVKQKF